MSQILVLKIIIETYLSIIKIACINLLNFKIILPREVKYIKQSAREFRQT